jgi:hypothetical protein
MFPLCASRRRLAPTNRLIRWPASDGTIFTPPTETQTATPFLGRACTGHYHLAPTDRRSPASHPQRLLAKSLILLDFRTTKPPRNIITKQHQQPICCVSYATALLSCLVHISNHYHLHCHDHIESWGTYKLTASMGHPVAFLPFLSVAAYAPNRQNKPASRAI